MKPKLTTLLFILLSVFTVTAQTEFSADAGKYNQLLNDLKSNLYKNESLKKVELSGNSSKNYLTVPEKELLAKGNPAQMVLEVKVKKGEATVAENLFYFKDVKALQLEKPAIEKNIEKSGDKYVVTLKSNTLAKNVALTTSSEGRFSNNYFDILPGKTYQINFTGKSGDLDKELKIMTLYQTY